MSLCCAAYCHRCGGAWLLQAENVDALLHRWPFLFSDVSHLPAVIAASYCSVGASPLALRSTSRTQYMERRSLYSCSFPPMLRQKMFSSRKKKTEAVEARTLWPQLEMLQCVKENDSRA